MKLSRPGDHADQGAEVEPDQGEADGVERAEDEADERLAADEAGDRPVDLAREPAHGRRGGAPAPSRRRPRPCGPSRRAGRRRRPGSRRGGRRRRRAPGRRTTSRAGSRRSMLRPASTTSPTERCMSASDLRAADALDAAARPARRRAPAAGRRIAGSRSMKAVHLVKQEGHHQHQRQDEDEDEEDEDQERRPEPPDAEPLEAVGDGVEEIGEREPGDERQEDVAKDVERERRRATSAASQNATCLWVTIADGPPCFRPPCGAAIRRDRQPPRRRSRRRPPTWLRDRTSRARSRMPS